MKKSFISGLLLICFVFLFTQNAFAWNWWTWSWRNNNNTGLSNRVTTVEQKTATHEEKIAINHADAQQAIATSQQAANTATNAYNKVLGNTGAINDLQINVAGINSDIEAINQAITASSDEISRNVYTDGFLIGKLKNIEGGRWYGILSVKFNDLFDEIKIKSDGKIKNFMENYLLYFKLPDCQGDIYVDGAWGDFGIAPLLGRVISALDNLYYYEPAPQNAYTGIMASVLYTGDEPHNCRNDSSGNTTGPYLKLKPNDPAITGIENYPFTLPLTIEGINSLNIITE